MLVRNLDWGVILRGLAPQGAGYAAVAVGAVLLRRIHEAPAAWGVDPALERAWSEAIGWTGHDVPFGAIAAFGTAVSIVLGFRNSSAYDRWWEARKIWGGLVNDSRSWCRQVCAWVDDAETRHDLVHRHLAFVHGLALHLRERPELLDTVGDFVDPEERARLAEVPNVPTALLRHQGVAIAAARRQGWIDDFQHLAMDGLLTRLSDIQGKCERIKNTPVPRQYDEIPRVAIVMYGLLLPFGLVGPLGWLTVPVATAITLMFVLLEGAGRVIEDPFEGQAMDTPMTALAITIERDLRAALREPLPDVLPPDAHGVLM